MSFFASSGGDRRGFDSDNAWNLLILVRSNDGNEDEDEDSNEDEN